MPSDIPVIIIAGPTAVGKSRLALHLAQQWNTGIISADSRQIYTYMDIGTGKPTKEEQRIAPHYMIDLITPDQTYNAGEYGRKAQELIDGHIKNQHIPILAGGTGLYIRAAVEGLAPSPPSDPSIKSKLQKRLKEEGVYALYDELLHCDPDTAKRLHANDQQRILRALEVLLITGEKLSVLHNLSPKNPKYRTIFLFINPPRDILYTLINQRIEAMFDRGLIEEAKKLLEMGYTPYDPGLQSLGYIHLYNYLHNHVSIEEAKRLMKRDTQRYAKRQVTWFKKEKTAIWIEGKNYRDILNETQKILSTLQV